MHEDPNEAPTNLNRRTREDLEMFYRDEYESRVLRLCSAVSDRTGLKYPDTRAEALRSMCGEGDMPPSTWRPKTEGERAVFKEFGLELPPLPEVGDPLARGEPATRGIDR